jgi:ATP-dependent DNA helicase RecG
MEEIPNKIRSNLGILAEVNLRPKDGLDVIEIVTAPYEVPISLRGRYYFRSGATKLELTGNNLNDFLLKKSGRSWDSTPEPNATLGDIDRESVRAYIEAVARSGRLPVEGLGHDRDEALTMLLDKLNLFEDGKLRRAALLLFGKEPRRFFANPEVRIGRFGAADDDLRFQEIEHGSILRLVRTVPEQLNSAFLTKSIDFRGLQRIEKGEYPVAAVREMLLNALVHRDYKGAAVQIRVYDNRILIWNEGPLPEGLTLDSLKRQHPSRPRNPLIAEALFNCGYIDLWGVGTLKIISACREAELPEPEIAERDGGVQVTLFKSSYTEELLRKLDLNDRQIAAVLFVVEAGQITNAKHQELFGVSRVTATRDLGDLVNKGVLSRTGVGAGSVYRLAIASLLHQLHQLHHNWIMIGAIASGGAVESDSCKQFVRPGLVPN